MLKRSIEIEVEIEDITDSELEIILGNIALSNKKLSPECVLQLVETLMSQGNFDEIIKLLFLAKDTNTFEIHPLKKDCGVQFKYEIDKWKFVIPQ